MEEATDCATSELRRSKKDKVKCIGKFNQSLHVSPISKVIDYFLSLIIRLQLSHRRPFYNSGWERRGESIMRDVAHNKSVGYKKVNKSSYC
jgi:hypothetical protein